MKLSRFIFLFILGAIGAFFIRTFGFEGIYLASNSMAPTLEEGRHIIANKFPLFFRKPKRGEIVMFEDPEGSEKGMVKRVIAVEGDEIAIKEKRVYLNNYLLEENYVQYLRADTLLVGDNIKPLKIPEDHVFVMGDNRDFSKDSRDWKDEKGEWIPFLPIDLIKGVLPEP